jgi:hypothetical protein
MATLILATDTPFTIQLTLRVTGSGFRTPQDAVSNVEHIVQQLTGNMPQGGISSLVSGGTGTFGAGAGAGAGTPQWETFLEQNMTTIMLGLAAIVVLPALVKKL